MAFYNASNSSLSNDLAQRLAPSRPNTELVAVELRGWQGGSIDDLRSFLERKTPCRVQLENVNQIGAVLHAQVRASDARTLLKCSGIRFAGNALRISQSAPAPASLSNGNSNTIQVLETFLNQRYKPETRMLDLQAMKSDEFLLSRGFFATSSTASKMFPALMKVADHLHLPVQSVNLAHNGIADGYEIAALGPAFPELQNLSLANNRLAAVKDVKGLRAQARLAALRELILEGNPVATLPHYRDSMVRLFPSLALIDNEVVQPQPAPDSAVYPLLIKQNFFETVDLQNLASQFLLTFLSLFDSDRTQLAMLYDATSTFSLSVNLTAPRDPPGRNSTLTAEHSWNTYIPVSRNLVRVTTKAARSNRLFIGQASIAHAFTRLPQTRHADPTQFPMKYSVDSWRVCGLRTSSDSGLAISVHGEFSEPASSCPVLRSFDRTFLLLPMDESKMIVVSDLLCVRPYSNISAFHDQPVPSELVGLSPQQIDFVQSLMQTTCLTAQYARMCAEQASFDTARALDLFSQSQATLPAHAFRS